MTTDLIQSIAIFLLAGACVFNALANRAIRRATERLSEASSANSRSIAIISSTQATFAASTLSAVRDLRAGRTGVVVRLDQGIRPPEDRQTGEPRGSRTSASSTARPDGAE